MKQSDGNIPIFFLDVLSCALTLITTLLPESWFSHIFTQNVPMNDQPGKNQQRTTCIYSRELIETQLTDRQKIEKLQYWENIKETINLKKKNLNISYFLSPVSLITFLGRDGARDEILGGGANTVRVLTAIEAKIFKDISGWLKMQPNSLKT